MADNTAYMERVYAEIKERFPQVRNSGIKNCRKIRNSSRWSQHSWGNAVDVGVPNLAYGDQVFTWVTANKTRLGLGLICWRHHGGCNAKDHQDHLHIESAQKQRGTPPCAGGSDSGGSLNPGRLTEFIPVLGPILGITGASEKIGEVGLEDLPVIGGPLDAATTAVAVATSPNTWLRVLWFGGGVALTAFGVVQFANVLTGANVTVRDIVNAGRTVATRGAA